MADGRDGHISGQDGSPDGLTLRVVRATGTLCVPVGPAGVVRPAGTVVARGDSLTDGPGALATTGGRIGQLRDVTLLGARTVRGVELIVEDQRKSEQEDSERESQGDVGDATSIGPTDLPAWASRLVAGGIGAERVGSPNLIEQLNHAMRRPVDTVICSLIDADPAVRLSTLMASRFSSEVVEAVVLLGRLTGAKQTLIVVDQQTAPRWWTSIRRAAKGQPVKLVGIAGRYPAGDPTLLLYSLLNRRLRPGRLPTDCGTLLLDASAAVSLGRLLRRGQPMLQTPVAVWDHRTGQITYCIAPVGLSAGTLLHELGLGLENATLRAGDILRDCVVGPDAVVGAGEAVVHVTHDPAPESPGACIRCGWCVDVCPTGVHPAAILGAAQQNDPDCARTFGLDACIECGLCTFVCPSKLPLLAAIRGMKGNG